MQISGNLNINNINISNAVEIDTLKKTEDVTKNQISYILDKNFENTKAIEEAAKFTGAGNNLNIKA